MIYFIELQSYCYTLHQCSQWKPFNSFS